MQYLGFGDFESFLNHNGKKRARRLKRKAQEARQAGREWRYKTEALFRKMVEQDGKLVLVGEFFKTQNTVEIQQNQFRPLSYGYDPFFDNPSFFNRMGQGFGSNRPVPSFNFTHAFALVTDRQGRVEWDGSFDIDKTVDGPLTNFGAFQWHNGQAYYAFYDQEELVVKHLNDQETETGHAAPVDLMNPHDELRRELSNNKGVLKWYNNKYLVYGIQHIRSSGKLRKVFFINGITVSPH